MRFTDPEARDPRFTELDSLIFTEHVATPLPPVERETVHKRDFARTAQLARSRRPRPGMIYRAAPPLPPRAPKEELLAIARRVEDGWIARKASA